MNNQLEHANPYTDAQIEELALPSEEALLASIIIQNRPARRRTGLRWPLAGLTAAGATAAAVLTVLVLGGSPPERAWSADAVRVAEAVPRLLLPGWEVTRADEFAVSDGEMEFTSADGHRLDLHWRGKGTLVRWMRSRAASAERLADTRVGGATAAVYRYEGTNNDFTALWEASGYTMELRSGDEGPRMSAREFSASLASLREVDVDAWLSALPESVVLPDERQRVIDEMLGGIPLPEGFDRAALESDAVSDRYQMGARVSGAVACAWIEQWVDGDAAARQQAADAMATSRGWPILREMQAGGAYPDAVWEYADAVNGRGQIIGGRPLTVEESYKDALGC